MSGVKGQQSGGHNRKPIALHVADGTYREDRHGGAMEAPMGQPKCPDWLIRADHKSEFDKAVDGLSKVSGLLSPLDANAIARYAMVVCDLAEASKTGDRKLAREAAKEMERFHAKFGMTPSDRAGIKIDSPQEAADSFEEFLKTKNDSA